ncbi:MAG: hypothetical protein ACLQGP_40630 [Isosphaeraceae bacterium]
MPMPEPETQGLEVEDPKVVLAEWHDRLDALVTDVKGWAEKSGWRTRVISKPMKDSALGPYKAPVLLMERDTVEVALNPVSRFVPGADGAVDLYLVPAYDDIASLYYEGDRWMIHYIFQADPRERHTGVEDEALPLSEETMTRVLNSIAAHA